MSNLVNVTYRGAKTDSDHYFIIVRLITQISIKKKKATGKCQKKYDISNYGCFRWLIAALESTECLHHIPISQGYCE